MELVVDANILFSAIVRDSSTRGIFYNEFITLYAPEYLLEELEEHREEIIQKAEITVIDFEELFAL